MPEPLISNLKFSEVYDLYVSLRSPYLSAASIDSIRDTHRSFLRHIPDAIASTYNGIDLLRFVRCVIDSGRRPSGINVDLRNLKAFGRWCEKQKLLERDNPFATVELLKVTAKPIRYLSSEEFRLIYAAEQKPLLRQIYLVALLTGQRCSDVLRLQWEHIDLQRAVIRTRNTKANRLCTLPLHPTLIGVLQAMGTKTEGPVFVGRRGEKLTACYVSHSFKRAAISAQIEDVSFHVLRKTFASWLALSGVGLHDIQKLLGHSSVTLTERYYAGLVASDLHDVVARLQLVNGSMPTSSLYPQAAQ
jgi:integrase